MCNVSYYNLTVVKERTKRYNIDKYMASPEVAYQFIKTVTDIANSAEEYMYMLTLDTKNNVTGVFEISHGSLNSSVCHPREIYKRALLMNASAIMIFHNHPSGDPTPSPEDENVTKRLYEAGKILGIDLLDHIVIGDGCYKSLKGLGAI